MKEFILMVVLLSGPVLANEQDNKAYAEEGEKAAIAVLKELRSRLTEKMAVDLVESYAITNGKCDVCAANGSLKKRSSGVIQNGNHNLPPWIWGMHQYFAFRV